MTRDEGIAILQSAALEPFGLLVHTSNPRACVQTLDRILKAEPRPDFALLVFKQVQFEDGNLVVMKSRDATPEGGPVDSAPLLPGLGDL